MYDVHLQISTHLQIDIIPGKHASLSELGGVSMHVDVLVVVSPVVVGAGGPVVVLFAKGVVFFVVEGVLMLRILFTRSVWEYEANVYMLFNSVTYFTFSEWYLTVECYFSKLKKCLLNQNQ